MNFEVEGVVIEGHEMFENNARQVVSGSLQVLARECNGCGKLLLADKFRIRYDVPSGKCKDCRTKVRIENEARKKEKAGSIEG